MTTGERFKKFLDDIGLSKNGLAIKIGVSSTVINGIVKDTNNPGHKVLMAIKEKYPNYNTDWLITGTGRMKEVTKLPDNDYLMVFLKKLEEDFKQQLAIKDQQIAMKDQQINKFLDLLGKLEGVSLALISQVEPIFGFNLEKFGYTHALKVA